MVYLGVDVHQRNCWVTVLEADGREREQRKLGMERATLLRYFGKIPKPAKVAVEATFNWYYFLNVIEPLGLELPWVHPQKTKAIARARIKHDQLDSRILARLLHAGFIAEAWIAPRPVRELRQLVRFRTRTVQWATRAKNGVHGVVNRQGIRPPMESLFGPKGRAFLAELDLAKMDRWEVDDQLARLDLLAAQIGKLDQEIRRRSRGSAVAQALEEIPGIGPFIALWLVAEIGDLGRFPTAKHLVSYLGLAPSLYASGEHRWGGAITKRGSSLLRWALGQAAHTASRSPRFAEFYFRLRERHGTAKAVVALARKLATISYYRGRAIEHQKKGPKLKQKPLDSAAPFIDALQELMAGGHRPPLQGRRAKASCYNQVAATTALSSTEAGRSRGRGTERGQGAMAVDYYEKVWHNGKFIVWNEATVHVASHVISYASCLFEGIRCYETPQGPSVFRLKEHVDRLVNSCKIYRMDLEYSREQLQQALVELVRVNQARHCYLRPVIFRGYGEVGVSPLQNPVEIYLLAWKWGKYLGDEALKHGVDVCVSSWHRLAPNTLPAMAKAAANYMNAQLIKMEAITNGYVEGIGLDTAGYISEGSGENIFVVRDGKLLTPPLGSSVLPGITRDSVITLARELGYTVIEQALAREVLYIADEVFFTGTAAEITPIRSVDRILVDKGEPGPITRSLQERFLSIVEGKAEDKYGWLTLCTQPVAAGR